MLLSLFNKNKVIAYTVVCLCAPIAWGGSALAESFESILNGGSGRFFEMFGEDYEDEYDDSYKSSKGRRDAQYIYEEITMQTLSKLYWGIGLLNLENDTYIDNYMKINECEIYSAYAARDFEWTEIRKATRDFISKNKQDFPMRFQYAQPLKLKDYDNRKRGFEVDYEYQYKSTRRFEVYAKDKNTPICLPPGVSFLTVLQGYPTGLLLELSRPFSLEYIPMDEQDAQDYLESILVEFKKLPTIYQSNSTLANMKNAYIVFKVKIFAHGSLTRGSYPDPIVQMLAALEGYEIYGDPQFKRLLHSRNYVQRTDASKQSERLLREFDILRDRSKNGGVLTNVN